MATKIRVFISSTMEDLGNERRAVVQELKKLNLDPVNAESLFPTGGTSWDVIQDEIRSSHIFVLLSGDSYGWVPKTGYGAGRGLSVTHLEFELARSSKIPILAFLKRLKPGEVQTNDTRLRDNFRREISDWDSGFFRKEFEWADELAKQVHDSLMDLFQRTFFKSEVRQRAYFLDRYLKLNPIGQFSSNLPIDSDFTQGNGVLLAGAGLSASVGYPTAAILSEILAQEIGIDLEGNQILSRHRFSDVAALAQETYGRAKLLDIIQEAMDTPQIVRPTSAHLDAVKAFEVIVTPNFDDLLEQACHIQGIEFTVRTLNTPSIAPIQGVAIYKIHGSINNPSSLILTEEDTEEATNGNVELWSEIKTAVQTRPLAVVGHSLRDTMSQKLVEDRRLKLPGVYVTPNLDGLDEMLLKRFRLKGIKANAEQFMSAIRANMT